LAIDNTVVMGGREAQRRKAEVSGARCGRRLNAALDRAPTLDRIHQKFAHLCEEKRQHEAEARGPAEVADLYE
jgi:hypothetical protein